MRCDDAEHFLAVETFEQGFGQRTAHERFRAAAELVDKQQCTLVAVPNEVFHVRQMRTVGAQIVLDALLVADIDKQALEDSGFRLFVKRDRDAALKHVLQQPDRFQTDRFTTGVRAGNDQQASCLV